MPPTTPPPPPPGKSKRRSFFEFIGRATVITLVVGAGGFYYVTQRERTPGPQLPFDPEKKTLVILGSGWGATSLLNTLDTTDYNVVRLAFLSMLISALCSLRCPELTPI